MYLFVVVETNVIGNDVFGLAQALLNQGDRVLPVELVKIKLSNRFLFRAEFELACQLRSVQLLVLPPHSPELNGYVERAHRTHQEEFYEVYLDDLHLAPLNAALLEWENTYNFIRPPQSLDGLTPAEYIQNHYPDLNPYLSHMY